MKPLIFAKKENVMSKKLWILVCFVTFAICTSASKLPLYLSRCPKEDNSHGNVIRRTPAQPLCIWQEQNCIYVPQDENIYCVLLDTDEIVYECIVPTLGIVAFPAELQGQYTLLIQMNGVSYKGEIYL